MISREEAINLLHILPVTVFEADYDKPFRDAIFMAIEALSQPERPKGHWIDKTIWYGTFGVCRAQCSECGTIFEGKPGSRGDGKGGKYCEECGADMRGEEE